MKSVVEVAFKLDDSAVKGNGNADLQFSLDKVLTKACFNVLSGGKVKIIEGEILKDLAIMTQHVDKQCEN